MFIHRCGENPSAKLQRVSSEDCRTQVLVQAVKQSAEIRSVSHAPKDVVGKVPRESYRECHQKTTEHQFCLQALKQSSEMQSALEFFATTQSYCERSLESVNRIADIGFSGFPGFLDFSSSEKFKNSPLVPAHPS